jgi:uncharacterized membrane protein
LAVQPRRRSTALDTLNQRLARGEIDRECAVIDTIVR